jgi:hypothetical protein
VTWWGKLVAAYHLGDPAGVEENWRLRPRRRWGEAIPERPDPDQRP